MRHARQLPERRGGDTGGSAWPSIVATTTSLGGAAAGIATLLLWDDTFHLRLGTGLAAAGALFSTVSVLFLRRDQQSRREMMAGAREDHVQELKFEIGRREHRITALRAQVMEAEETVLLFEQRVQAELARAEASDAARARAEHDLAVLSAWIEQARAAAELSQSSARSAPGPQAVPARAARYELAAAPGPHHNEPAYAGEGAYAELTYVAQPGRAAQPGARSVTQAAPRRPVDLTPAAAVPVSPIMAAAVEELNRVTPDKKKASRPLRPAVLKVREDVGFDVADDVHSAVPVPYVVPGVTLPTQRDAAALRAIAPSRPIAPERLYRPYLGSPNGAVDLTMYDETQQMGAVQDRRTGTV